MISTMMVLVALTGITLEFDSEQIGIKDINGTGVGFNARFPGSVVYENDPNLELDVNLGVLKFKGQYADWANNANIDLPAISFNGFPGPATIKSEVGFKNLSLDTLDSATGLFVGIDPQNVLIISADAYYNPISGGADGSFRVSLTSIKNDVWSNIELPSVFPAGSDLNLSFTRNDLIGKNHWVGLVEVEGESFPLAGTHSFGGYYPEIFTGIFNINGDSPVKTLEVEVDRFQLSISEETAPWGWPEPFTLRAKREQENQVFVATTIPEPSAGLLFIVGILVLLAKRAKR